MKKLDRGKHSSLFYPDVDDEAKKFLILTGGCNDIAYQLVYNDAAQKTNVTINLGSAGLGWVGLGSAGPGWVREG